MNDARFKKIMSDEIGRRLGSDAWNLEVATGVMAQKKRSRMRAFYLSSFAASAAAAAFAVIFLFGINTGRHAAGYEDFITRQIEGTAIDAVGGNKKTANTAVSIHEVILLSNTDSMIDDTLAMR